jgi:multidrug resistance efflux pump
MSSIDESLVRAEQDDQKTHFRPPKPTVIYRLAIPEPEKQQVLLEATLEVNGLQRFYKSPYVRLTLFAMTLIGALASGMVYWNNSTRRSLGMSESTVFEGTMQPVMEVRVTALVPGIVAMVSTHVGDHVNEGDVLVTMHSHEAEEEVAKAQLAYDAVQRNLAKLRGDLARTEVNVAAATRQAALVPSRQVRDSVQHARAVYDQALTDYRSNEKLYSQGVIAKQVLDNSATALRIARDGLENAHRGETANQEVQQLQGKQGELLSQISQREQLDQVKEARLALQSASARLANTKVRATSSGVVCTVSVKVGDQVSVGAPLVVVSRMDRITVNVPVAASMIASLQKSQQAQIILPTMPPQRVLGAIRAISPVPSANMTHNVEVEFDNPTGQLLTGQPAEVRFVFE